MHIILLVQIDSIIAVMHIMLIIFFCMFAVLRGAAVQRLPHRILQVIQTETKPLTTILRKRHQVLHLERNPRTA